MKLKEMIAYQKEYRVRKRAYFEAAKGWKFDGMKVPMCKVFGQYIAFPCGSHKQFFKAGIVIAALCTYSDRATKKLDKLEAQLKKIQELSDQLSGDKDTSLTDEADRSQA